MDFFIIRKTSVCDKEAIRASIIAQIIEQNCGPFDEHNETSKLAQKISSQRKNHISLFRTLPIVIIQSFY